MRDVNYPIRKAYIAALSGLSYDSKTIGVHYQLLPDKADNSLYVIIESVSNNGSGTINSQDTLTSVTLTIHSSGLKYSNGQAVDNVAGQIMQIISASPSSVLDLSADDLQMISSRLTADNTRDYTSEGAKIYIDRTLIFEHDIYQK